MAAPSETRASLLVRTVAPGLHLALPVLLGAGLLLAVLLGDATDFDTNVWFPAEAVRAGRSPYPPPDLRTLIEPTFLYPPLLLGLDLPLSFLPHGVARTAFWLLELASVLGAMALVGVKDRRIYVWAALAYPAWTGQVLGNPTLLLLAPLGAAWRWRDTWWAVGLIVGFIGAFKLILWPLGLWLIVSRRLRGAALAAATALILVLCPWAIIGFDGLADYPDLLQIFGEKSGAPRAFTLATLMSALGAPSAPAHALRWIGGAAMVAALIVVARRPQGDRRAFSLAIATVIVISPVVERVYLATLLVPLALARPSFGWIWGHLVALWLIPVFPNGPLHTVVENGELLKSHGYVPTIPQLLIGLSFVAAVIAVTARPCGDDGRAEAVRDGEWESG